MTMKCLSHSKQTSDNTICCVNSKLKQEKSKTFSRIPEQITTWRDTSLPEELRALRQKRTIIKAKGSQTVRVPPFLSQKLGGHKCIPKCGWIWDFMIITLCLLTFNPHDHPACHWNHLTSYRLLFPEGFVAPVSQCVHPDASSSFQGSGHVSASPFLVPCLYGAWFSVKSVPGL